MLQNFANSFAIQAIARLVPDARDAGQRGPLHVRGVRAAVGREVGRAERELVGLQGREEVAVAQLAADHLRANRSIGSFLPSSSLHLICSLATFLPFPLNRRNRVKCHVYLERLNRRGASERPAAELAIASLFAGVNREVASFGQEIS